MAGDGFSGIPVSGEKAPNSSILFINSNEKGTSPNYSDMIMAFGHGIRDIRGCFCLDQNNLRWPRVFFFVMKDYRAGVTAVEHVIAVATQ